MVQGNGSAAPEFNRSVFPDTKVELIHAFLFVFRGTSIGKSGQVAQ
jgi:hypothetical protein